MLVTSDDRWKALFSAGRVWGAEPHFDQLLARIVGDAVQFSGLEFCTVFLLERDGLLARASAPLGRPVSKHLADIAQESIRTGRVISGHDVNGAATTTIFCAPLTAARGILGALYLETLDPHVTLSDRDREFFETLALQAATAIEHANLYHSAITDPLTGLLTHRQFQQEVEHAVRRAGRTESAVSLLLLDLDHFKKLNDQCGHATGNACLNQVAAILKRVLRSTDVIARFGGDEFEVLLPDTPLESATIVAEKIRKAIGELQFDVRVSGTIGVAAHPFNAADGATLFLRADAALYEAKEAGRDRVVCASQKEAPASKASLRRVEEAGKSRRASESDDNQTAIRLAENLQEKIDGHVLVRRLGTGSNGEVLLVKQPDLDREVALKRPLTTHLNPEQMRAFEREARLTASLSHPGIVTVHAMGRDVDGRRYYTMKPLDGFSLAHVLEQHRRQNLEIIRDYSQSRLLEVLQRASETLAYAHQRGVPHLDITPSNLVIGDFGEVTVIDWGCVKSSGSSGPALSASPGAAGSGLSLIVGSPRYLAPEQVPPLVAPVGPPADVFALGAILYEILTLRPPFQGETLDETLRLLAAGNPVPPEQLAPDACIDPMLTGLCMSALKSDPAQRPSAQEFSDKLGRYVRREAEWIVTRFGPEHPLREDEWQVYDGKFELRDGEFVSVFNGTYEHFLLWKVPVQGSFRFVAECWLEGHDGELSLIGATTLNPKVSGGYIFHFGAEKNSLTKLTRVGASVAVTRDPIAEPGRKYRLEMEYLEQEGWLRCYVDGKLVFNYREMFSFPGNHIGFYSFLGGSHLRPLEVHRQEWGLQVPAIRSADSLYRHQSYVAALERYGEIAERASNRLEGFEARLKMAMCLSRMGQVDEARAKFKSLAGTAMEPFALAEQATLELFDWRRPNVAVQLSEDLLQRFPSSQAKWRFNGEAINVLHSGIFSEYSADEGLRFQLRWLNMAGKALWPPTSNNLAIISAEAQVHAELGEWSTALQTMQALHAALPERQGVLTSPYLAWAALSNGRDDLLKYEPWELTAWNMFHLDWNSGLSLHVVARLNKFAEFMAFCKEHRYMVMNTDRGVAYHDLLLVHLAAGDTATAALLFEKVLEHKKPSDSFFYMRFINSLIECEHDEMVVAVQKDRLTTSSEDVARFGGLIRGKCAFQRGDFEQAASHLSEFQEPRWEFFRQAVFAQQAMLVSLGYLKGPVAERIRNEYPRLLTGGIRDLVEMFLEEREAKPTAKWPHPRWHPEWRLWLGMWLEARSRRAEAAEIIRPSIDARYGPTYFQPALKRLLQRLS